MSQCQSNSGVRFTLKKRSIRNCPDQVNISSYNSDFLSGLFNDVAKISEQSDSEGSGKRGPEHVSSDAVDQPSLIVSESPMKKRRTSLSRLMSRSRFSTMNLTDLDVVQSPKAITEFFRPSDSCEHQRSQLPAANGKARDHQITKAHTTKSLITAAHHDSLAFQLYCVAGSDTNSPSSDLAAIIAFPNLPATVSDSSCSAGLTRVNLIRQASSLEKQPKESFGWFVDLDDHHTVETRAGLPYSASKDDLAFQAPTAPHGNRNDAEVQWAKAADTVDDVLGDFF